jgi:hypothetical protein
MYDPYKPNEGYLSTSGLYLVGSVYAQYCRMQLLYGDGVFSERLHTYFFKYSGLELKAVYSKPLQNTTHASWSPALHKIYHADEIA